MATPVDAVRDDDLAQEVVVVNGREMRKVSIGEVGSDVPFLRSRFGVEGYPSGICLFDEAGMMISRAVLVRDGRGTRSRTGPTINKTIRRASFAGLREQQVNRNLISTHLFMSFATLAASYGIFSS